MPGIMAGLEIPLSCFKIKTKEQWWQQKSEKALSHQNRHSVKRLWNRCLFHHLYPRNQGWDIEYINKDNKAPDLSQALSCRNSLDRLVKWSYAPTAVFASHGHPLFSLYFGGQTNGNYLSLESCIRMLMVHLHKTDGLRLLCRPDWA